MNNYDDPRLTAYLLDELPEEERREFERLLEEDPQLRAELDSLRAASESLDLHLSRELLSSDWEIGDQRREEILQSLSGDQDAAPQSGGRDRSLRFSILTRSREGLALAACLILAFGLYLTLPSQYGNGSKLMDLVTGDTSSSHRTIVALPVPSEPGPPGGSRSKTIGQTAEELGASQTASSVSVLTPPLEKRVQAGESTKSNASSRDLKAAEVDAVAAKTVGGASSPQTGTRRVDQSGRSSEPAVGDEDAQRRFAQLERSEASARDLSRGQLLDNNVEKVQAEQKKDAHDRSRQLSENRQELPINGRNVVSFAYLNSRGEVVPPPASPTPVPLPRPNPYLPDSRSTQPRPVDREGYDHIQENDFQRAAESPLSTFSIDVDTASYSNVRRFLQQGQRPPRDAVRIEELINYFRYNYPQPLEAHPFSVNTDLIVCPWQPQHYLLRVGLQGLEVDASQRPPANLVFLIDTSGSMSSPDKLPLLQQAFRMLAGELRPQDQIAIVTYAGSAGLVLPSTPGTAREQIEAAIGNLRSGGSTNGAGGIRLAYQTARQHFIEGGINRVLLATDGDFNVGVSSQGELVELIEQERQSGVFLTVLGFGSGNLQDSKMEQLADHGNGHYAYIDSLREARKTLVEGAGGALMTIAKDVKIQVEFNPLEVGAYRLIGYENRRLQAEDFNDDRKDAGEIGAGHSVTALYEIIPAGLEGDVPAVDSLRYQQPTVPSAVAASGELATVKLRYKRPQESHSLLLEQTVAAFPLQWRSGDPETLMAASAAIFGMLLRQSAYSGQATPQLAEQLALAGMAFDPGGHRAEYLSMLRSSRQLLLPRK
ncbi:MAG TPA: VWA domain-containing protein [Acidobacteriota bacterium]|nr:VWA domain-containing protein [Acidobacteriota bacterium]